MVVADNPPAGDWLVWQSRQVVGGGTMEMDGGAGAGAIIWYQGAQSGGGAGTVEAVVPVLDTSASTTLEILIASAAGDPGTYGGGTAPTPGGFWFAGGGGCWRSFLSWYRQRILVVLVEVEKDQVLDNFPCYTGPSMQTS